MISIFLLFLLAIFSIALYISVKKNFELFDRLQQVDDSLQECVKVLNEQIEKMEKKTKIEVFSDEPIIRDLINDMSTAKEAVVIVSGVLDDLVDDGYENEEQDEIEA